jgi:hypothetical protein
MLEEGKKGKRTDLQNNRRMMGRNVGKVVVTLRTRGKVGYTVKRLSVFPSPVGMSLTKLFLSGNNLITDNSPSLHLSQKV